MEKLTKAMTIGLTEDGQAAVSISPDTTLTEALQLSGTLITHILNAYTEVATQQLRHQQEDYRPSQRQFKDIDVAIKGIRDSMYDAVDNIFSNILYNYQPDHPRYTLEDEAIIELVNQKITEQYNKLSKEEQAAYRQQYSKVKEQLKFRSQTNASDSTTEE